MKQLTLIRHAKSSWDPIGLADIDRPLSARGRRDAPEMGRRLKTVGFAPDCVLVSPSLRTRQTTQALWDELCSEPIVRTEPALYMASTSTLLALIEATEATINHLVLIGHNPGLTLLVNHLGVTISNIPTAGVARFGIDAGYWSPLDLTSVQLIDFDYPKRKRA